MIGRFLLATGALCLAVPISAQGEAQPSLAKQTSGPSTSLDAHQKAEIVETMATAAEQLYVDAAAGGRIAAELRQRLSSGAYDALADGHALAAALTQDMQSVVKDNHLRAVYEPDRAERDMVQRMVSPGSASPAPYARIDSRSTEQIAASNFGFEKVERLSGNVGYLKLDRLVPLPLSKDTAEKAMASLAGSKALIIDLRGVPGGSPDLVVHLISYFTNAEPVRLMTTYNRALDETEELWSAAEVAGIRMTGVPLFLLLDKRTASAAEMFAYFVQRQNLGTIIGETSAGAGHGGNMIPVGSDISFFLPQRRIVDGPGWEGIGIKPDIAVPTDKALEEALRLAGESGSGAIAAKKAS